MRSPSAKLSQSLGEEMTKIGQPIAGASAYANPRPSAGTNDAAPDGHPRFGAQHRTLRPARIRHGRPPFPRPRRVARLSREGPGMRLRARAFAFGAGRGARLQPAQARANP